MIKIQTFVLAATLSLSGCMGGQTAPKTYSNTVAPTLSMTAARTRVSAPLSIVVASGVPEQATILRGQGKVTVQIQNFKAAIGETLKKALADNFSAITINPVETKQGIELVVLGANVGKEVDTLSYHVALTKDGQDVYEVKGEIQPVTKMVQANAFTWMDTTAQLTTEFVAENIAHLAEEVSGKLLISEDPRLTSFWSAQQNPPATAGGEAASAVTPVSGT